MPVDLSSVKDVAFVVENVQPLVRKKVPIRFGLVPSARSQAAKDQAKLAYHLLDTYGLGGLMAYLETVSGTLDGQVAHAYSHRRSIRMPCLHLR